MVQSPRKRHHATIAHAAIGGLETDDSAVASRNPDRTDGYPFPTIKAERGCGRGGRTAGIWPRRLRYHFVTGGYFDNYGVATLVEWLEDAFRAEFAAHSRESSHGYLTDSTASSNFCGTTGFGLGYGGDLFERTAAGCFSDLSQGGALRIGQTKSGW